MITTVTLNPSLDLTLEVEQLTVGSVNRARSERIHAAGKGVNVAVALHAHGIASTAIVALPAESAARYVALMPTQSILDVIAVDGLIRTNVAIVEPHGVVTKVNGPGPLYSRDTVAAVVAGVGSRIRGSRWLVLSGSLPPGCPDDTYASLVSLAHAADCRVAIDADGDALRAVVAAAPDLIKPNRHELAALVGRELGCVGDVLDAAEEVVRDGVGAVLCSLGPDGAVLVEAGAPAIQGSVPPLTVENHVGAGDALLAGFLSQSTGGAEAMRAAVAWGTAACRLPGTQMPGPAHIDPGAVIVDLAPDRARSLTLGDVLVR